MPLILSLTHNLLSSPSISPRFNVLGQVKPKNVFGITLPELLACGKADHVILMLVDANYIFHNENLEDPQDPEMEDEGEGVLEQQPIASAVAES